MANAVNGTTTPTSQLQFAASFALRPARRGQIIQGRGRAERAAEGPNREEAARMDPSVRRAPFHLLVG